MSKQQASLFVAYKGQLTLYKLLSKMKRISNKRHSLYIKSALIIFFTQIEPGIVQHNIKPSFIFQYFVFLLEMSSGNISINYMYISKMGK